MPKTNPLYHFLANPSALSALPRVGIAFKETVESKKYTLLTLKPASLEINVAGKIYTMAEHHISIFQDYKYNRESDYHYTATLRNETGHRFKLHIYFDKYDQVIDRISLRSEAVAGAGAGAAAEEEINVAGDSHVLTTIAMMYSSPLLSQIRFAQTNHLGALSTKMAADMAALFSLPRKDAPDLDVCASQAEILMKEANTLQCYGGSDEPYKMLVRYCEGIAWAQTDLHIDNTAAGAGATTISSHHETSEAVTTSSASSASAAGHTMPHNKTDVERQQKMRAELAELQEVTVKLEALAHIDLKSSAQDILNYNLAAKAAWGSLINADNPKVNSYIGIVSKHLVASDLLCIKKLEAAVIIDDLTAMESLKGFAKQLPDKFVAQAIARNKHARLEWLLANGDFSVNRICVQQEEHQIPLLDFAFKKKSVECFKELLAHGASSMVESEHGLPLAHHVLKPGCGVFYTALVESILKHYAPFMKQLINILNTQKLDPDLSTAITEEIDTAILFYQRGIPAGGILKKGDTRALRDFDDLLSSVSEDSVVRFRADKAVCEKIDEYIEAAKEFMEKLSPAENRMIRRENKRLISELKDHAAYLETALSDRPAMIKELDNNIKLLNLLSKRLDIARDISARVNKIFTKGALKKFRALQAWHADLTKQINEMTADLSLSPPAVRDAIQKQKEIKEFQELLDSMADSMKSMAEQVNNLLKYCLESLEAMSGEEEDTTNVVEGIEDSNAVVGADAVASAGAGGGDVASAGAEASSTSSTSDGAATATKGLAGLRQLVSDLGMFAERTTRASEMASASAKASPT